MNLLLDAKLNKFAIVTTEADFLVSSHRFGWPPRVVHLKRCNFPLRIIEEKRSKSL